jgi:hypothetical protein
VGNTESGDEGINNISQLAYVLSGRGDQNLCFRGHFLRISKGCFISGKRRQQLNGKLLKRR